MPPADFAKVTEETAARTGRLKAGDADEDEDEAGVDEDVLGLAEYRDEKIDLGEVVREQLYLALPMKPLCREDCKVFVRSAE